MIGPGRRPRAGRRGRGLACSCEQDSIAEVRFRAFGCPHLLAAASWSMERITAIAVERGAALGHWQEVARELQVPAGQIRALAHAAGCNPGRAVRNWPGADPSLRCRIFAAVRLPDRRFRADGDFPDSCRCRTRPHVHGQPGQGRRPAARRQADRLLRFRLRRELRGRGRCQRYGVRRRRGQGDRRRGQPRATSTAPRSTSCARASTRPSGSAIRTSRANAAAARASMSNCPSTL